MTVRTNGQYQHKLTGADFHPGRRKSQHRRRCRGRGTVLLCAVTAVLCTLWLLS